MSVSYVTSKPEPLKSSESQGSGKRKMTEKDDAVTKRIGVIDGKDEKDKIFNNDNIKVFIKQKSKGAIK